MKSNSVILILVVIICLYAWGSGGPAPAPKPHQRPFVTRVVHWVSRIVYLATGSRSLFRDTLPDDKLIRQSPGPEEPKRLERSDGPDGQLVLNHADCW